MTGPGDDTPVSIVLPVYNGAETVASVIESVLAQSCPDLELVISDNASEDGTEDICRELARQDSRIVYHRHPVNVGLLNNFAGSADRARGTFLRWIGDEDTLEPDYVRASLEAFAQDPRRVLVTTQIVYIDEYGAASVVADHDPAHLASPDPVERFAEMLRLLTVDYATLDPIYGMIRRELAVMPRRNMLREDQIFAARLALAGPWGHVPAALARRHRHEATAAQLATLLGVPSWHQHVRVLLQCRELSAAVRRSSLSPSQRRRASEEILRFYARGKRIKAQRGYARLRHASGRLRQLAPSGAR